MNVPTCYGCSLRKVDGKRCQILESKLAAVRGAGISSIKFKCATRDNLFQPGQAVGFMVRADRDDDGYGRYALDECFGWVWKMKGQKVVVVSDETDKPILKYYPTRLTKIPDEPKRCCIHCGKPEGVADQIKSKGEDKPHKYVCRTVWKDSPLFLGGEYGDLPCEYEAAKEQAK